MERPADRGRHAGDTAGVATESKATLRVRVLGPLVVERHDSSLHVAGSHRRRLFALLASRAGRVVPVDAIVDALWGDDPPPTATKTIQSHVARLRSSFADLGSDLIETVAGGYRLALDSAAVDAIVFERMADEGRRRLVANDFAAALSVLDEALALWRGPAYMEFAAAQFAAAEAIRLDELRWAATEDLAEARLESGAVESVTADLERLVAEQPGRERAWGLLMRALYAAGRQHDALVAFQRARRALTEGFGLDPGTELRALERRVLEQDPTLTVRRRPTVPAALCRDSNPFVGRSRELAWLADAWRVARGGSGQLRVLMGPVDAGRTRLAAEVAATAIADGGQIVHVRGADGFDRSLGLVADDAPATQGNIVDEVTERSRIRPVLVVVDDAEWSSATTAATISTLADAIEHAAVMLLVIADPTGSGPAIQTLHRLDRSGGRTVTVEPMPDDALARVVIADGVDSSGVAAVVAISAGLPGVARREAAAWAERVASDRLTAAAASSIGATAVADEARASVFDDVLALVAARARRDELVSSTWMGRQPYRALAAYGPQDADLFVGRERLVAELAARILNRRLVVVVGASGSGKSSLARAGLVPLVRSGRLPGSHSWRTNVIVPGADPLAALDGVGGLDEPGPQLLVVDQFEEVFATDVFEVFAARLVDLVLDSTLDVHVVLVVGAGHYPTLAATPPLTELVDEAQVFVGPPTDDELRRIIEVPARRTGCAVEPTLVTLIAADVADRDAALPLVSATLAQVWESRDGDTLTADRYLQLGGLAAAVQRMGAKAVERSGGEDVLREVMLRLVDVTEDGQWVRRRIDVTQIPVEHAAAVDALIDARLVQRDDDQIDVVHEVVFRAWPLLVSWLDEARGDLVLERELRAAALAWETQGRSDDDVYRGARLAAAAEFTARRQDIVAPVPEFIEAGLRIAEHEHEQTRHQLAREVRARRRLGRALASAAVLLVAALIGGALAVVNARRADEQRHKAANAASLAEQRQRDAETARLVAESERALDSHLDLGLLLAAESYRRADTTDTRGALLTALTHNMSAEVPTLVSDVVSADVHRTHSQFLGFMSGPPGRPLGLDLSDDGRILATLRYEDDTTCGCALGLVFDMITRREIGRFEIPLFAVVGVDISPDGRTVLTASLDGVYVYDVAQASTTKLDFAPPAGGWFQAQFFTAGGDRFVVGTSDGALSLWDAASLNRINIDLPTSPLGRAGLAPDGSLAIGLPDPAVMFWDIDAGTESRRVPLEAPPRAAPTDGPPPRPGSLDRFAFSTDLSLLAANEDRGQVLVWDLTTGRLRGDPADRPGAARGIAFAPGSTVMAVATSTGGISLYDMGAEKLVGAPLRGHGGGVGLVAFSADGRYLASAGDDGLIALWGDNAGPGLIVEPIAGAQMKNPDYSNDGSRLLLDAGGHPEMRDGHTPTSPGVDVTPSEFDGRQLFVDELSDDGSTVLLFTLDQPTTLIAVDADTGRTRWSVEDPELLGSAYISYPLSSLAAISPDGRYVAALSQRRALKVWDIQTGQQLGQFDADEAPGDATAHAVMPLISAGHSFSADGQYIYAYVTPTMLRLATTDLHIVDHVDLPVVRIWGNVADVPGTHDVIGAGFGGRIFRWNVATGKIVASGRSGDASLLGNVTVSPDGSIVAAYHQFSSRMALFDAETLRPIGKPIPVSDNLFRPQFTGDGTFLAGNGIWGASATRWTMDVDKWLAAACRAAGRNMTKSEWAEYLGDDEPYRPTCPNWPFAD